MENTQGLWNHREEHSDDLKVVQHRIGNNNENTNNIHFEESTEQIIAGAQKTERGGKYISMGTF